MPEKSSRRICVTTIAVSGVPKDGGGRLRRAAERRRHDARANRSGQLRLKSPAWARCTGRHRPTCSPVETGLQGWRDQDSTEDASNSDARGVSGSPRRPLYRRCASPGGRRARSCSGRPAEAQRGSPERPYCKALTSAARQVATEWRSKATTCAIACPEHSTAGRSLSLLTRCESAVAGRSTAAGRRKRKRRQAAASPRG